MTVSMAVTMGLIIMVMMIVIMRVMMIWSMNLVVVMVFNKLHLVFFFPILQLQNGSELMRFGQFAGGFEKILCLFEFE